MAPPPPAMAKRRRPVVAMASGILSFVGIVALAAFGLFYFSLDKISAPGPLQADKVVYIETGTDTGGIVELLEHEGVIDNWPLMTGALYLRGERKKIKAGEYLFKQNASLNDVIETLVTGKQILHSITLPEGLTSEQMIQRIKDDPILVGDVRSMPKEGTLMPDTFKFARGTKRDQIIANMAQEQKKVVADVWAHRSPDTPIKSPFEMITLASIVEKETGRADERPRVAGVFVNRLLKGIPLQSDPTIVYGLVGGKGTLGRGILKSELEQKTPYNTYAISGLPPGPICNPGRAAMEAVANPSRTKDIYFVADGTGGHAFAETLDQHRANVTRWRQIEKDAKDKSMPDATPAPGMPAPAKPNQHGENWPSVPVYGALNTHFLGVVNTASLGPTINSLESTDYPLSLADEDRALSKLQPMMPTQTASAAPGDGEDELGSIPGVDTTPPPGDMAAFAAPHSAEEANYQLRGSSGTEVTFPVSPARRAEEKALAAQYGVNAGSDTLPPQTETISSDPAAAGADGQKLPGKGRIIDVSEGTRLDPLLNKTYDLNSPKTVPADAFSFAKSGTVLR